MRHPCNWAPDVSSTTWSCTTSYRRTLLITSAFTGSPHHMSRTATSPSSLAIVVIQYAPLILRSRKAIPVRCGVCATAGDGGPKRPAWVVMKPSPMYTQSRGCQAAGSPLRARHLGLACHYTNHTSLGIHFPSTSLTSHRSLCSFATKLSFQDPIIQRRINHLVVKTILSQSPRLCAPASRSHIQIAPINTHLA
jgi:hypothetical protein